MREMRTHGTWHGKARGQSRSRDRLGHGCLTPISRRSPADQLRREAVAGVEGLGRARHGCLITDPRWSGNPARRQLGDAKARLADDAQAA